MICKHSLKHAKGNSAATVIASQMESVARKRSRMGTSRAMASLDEKVTGLAMVNANRKRIGRETENAVPKVIGRVMVSVVQKANAVTEIAAQRDVRMVALANDLLRAIVLPKVIAVRTATVRRKGKVVEARCLGSLNCSTRTKMAGSAAMNSIV